MLKTTILADRLMKIASFERLPVVARFSRPEKRKLWAAKGFSLTGFWLRGKTSTRLIFPRMLAFEANLRRAARKDISRSGFRPFIY